ncbi:hypothetical protein Dvar_70170 [Desulfosarcina variabilis str. Montpellier]|uniref:hypothetical protein n=1 Tax=Desulfosarcina variabilis TaxID=2300 RepID=UPI003AFA2C7A
MLSPIAKKAIEVYGGANLWLNSDVIEAEVSVKGLAFTLKRRQFFNRANIKMAINRPYSILTPIGNDKRISGILDNGNVRLENQRNEIIAERKNARTYFPYGRRLFYWDDLDMAYFANYAFWNYFTFPALLMNKEIIWEEKTDSCLQATFPNSIPTHNAIQSFHFDVDNGLLFQHDYTADIISKYAQATNVVLKHEEKNGVLFPSVRKVTPRGLSGKPMNWPILIEIKVHAFEVIRTASNRI